MTARADHLLSLLGDDLPRAIVRALFGQPRTQAQLVEELGSAQAAVSKALGSLQLVGAVQPQGRRPTAYVLVAADLCRSLLLAADHYAEALLEQELEQQRNLTRDDRRSGLTAATDDQSRPAPA